MTQSPQRARRSGKRPSATACPCTGSSVAALVLGLACTTGAIAQTAAEPRPAEPATIAANQRLQQSLPFADQTDFEEAGRGFIASLPDGEIRGADGRIVHTMKGHAFIDAQAQPPDSINPSLWRQAKLSQIHGLVKGTDRVYQVRSLDTRCARSTSPT